MRRFRISIWKCGISGVGVGIIWIGGLFFDRFGIEEGLLSGFMKYLGLLCFFEEFKDLFFRIRVGFDCKFRVLLGLEVVLFV